MSGTESNANSLWRLQAYLLKRKETRTGKYAINST